MVRARDALAKAKPVKPGQQIGNIYELYERAVACNPYDPEAWDGRTEVANLLGRINEAGIYQRKAQGLRTQIGRQRDPAYTALSEREQEVVNLSDRIQTERKAGPSHAVARALLQRAWAHDALGHQDLALADFAAAIAEDPDYASEAYRDRAKYYQRHKLADLATRDTQQADAREPQENEARLRGLEAGIQVGKERMDEGRTAVLQRLEKEDPRAYAQLLARIAEEEKESSAACSVTATVTANSNLTAAFGGCGRDLNVQSAKLPVAISEELKQRAGRRGVQTGFDLSAPFVRWLLLTNRLKYNGSARQGGGLLSGTGSMLTLERQFFLEGLGSCHVTVEGSTMPRGAGEVCFDLLALARLVGQGEFETLQHLIDGYLDFAVHAAPASPSSNPARPLAPRADQEHINKEITP